MKGADDICHCYATTVVGLGVRTCVVPSLLASFLQVVGKHRPLEGDAHLPQVQKGTDRAVAEDHHGRHGQER